MSCWPTTEMACPLRKSLGNWIRWISPTFMAPSRIISATNKRSTITCVSAESKPPNCSAASKRNNRTAPTRRLNCSHAWHRGMAAMLRMLSDEDIPGDIVRVLRQRHLNLDIVRVQEVGLKHTPDAQILEWA